MNRKKTNIIKVTTNQQSQEVRTIMIKIIQRSQVMYLKVLYLRLLFLVNLSYLILKTSYINYVSRPQLTHL